MLEVVGQDIISGNMGFIGTDPGREYRMGAAEKTEDITVTGNPAVLDNATGKPFKDLHIYGRSEQMTTTGAQLLDLDALELRQETGATIKRLDDGGFLVDGTPKKAYEQYITKVVINLAPGTYFVSGGRYTDGCAVAQINILNADGTKKYKSNASFDVLGTEQEITLVIQSVSKAPINNYKIYPMINSGSVAMPFEPYTGGKPSPSPDYPQEIQSAGDDGNLSVIVKNPDNEQMQSVSFSTPNGLPGIPVASGGNYTDENGQQWICDEVDLGRGVYRQRIKHVNAVFKKEASSSTHSGYRHVAGDIQNMSREHTECLCNIATHSQNAANGTEGVSASGAYNALVLYYENLTLDNVSADVAYILSDPIETPLTAAEIAAYKSLRTYRGTTIVEAEDKAGISATFKRNVKTGNVSAEKKIEESEKKEYDES